MPVRWQTHDALFARSRPRPTRGKKDVPITPRPGEQLRWCQHDVKLLHRLTQPDVYATFGKPVQAFLAELKEKPTVTLEQVGWLRGLARRVSFKGTNGSPVLRALRFDDEL